MPIYSYDCSRCNIFMEVFCEIEEADYQMCETCGDLLSKRMPVFANTPRRWGDSHGYFDRGLGCYVANSMERERIMKEKGLRPVSQQELDEVQHQESVDHLKHTKDVETFSTTLKKTNSFAKAASVTFDKEIQPDNLYRNNRYEFEKPWKDNLKVITNEEQT